MSIFANIWSKVTEYSKSTTSAVAAATANTVSAIADGATSTAAAQSPSGSAQGAADADKKGPTLAAQIDVDRVLTDLSAGKKEQLNWRTSIVDLMKVLDMDSSLPARKSLAQELQYSGDMNDSASMNIWLHKEVVRRFAQNGGRVPSDLLD